MDTWSARSAWRAWGARRPWSAKSAWSKSVDFTLSGVRLILDFEMVERIRK